MTLRPVAGARSEDEVAQGAARGRLEAIGLEERGALELETFSVDALGTARIEGEARPPESVRSSVASRLGTAVPGAGGAGRDLVGLVEMLDDATKGYDEPLTEERLFGWHAALFPTGFSGLQRVSVGTWRREPIAVQSGSLEKARTHFQAPPPKQVRAEMGAFLDWWNGGWW